MGANTYLYLNAAIDVEAIAVAVRKAAGAEVRLVDDSENIFVAQDYIKVGYPNAVTYKVISMSDAGEVSLHWKNHAPLGPCWMLSGRSRAEVIAVFRTVAEAFGGFLVWSDYNDNGQIWGQPEKGHSFEADSHTAFSIQQATITDDDEQHSSYEFAPVYWASMKNHDKRRIKRGLE